MVKWLMTGPFPQLKRKSSSEEGKSHKQKGGLWTIPKRWTEISKIYIDKWINRRKRVWNLARWQAGLKAILVAVVGGWWEGGGGCPLNNNHCYSSKTFPHPLAVFFFNPSFYLLSQPHSSRKAAGGYYFPAGLSHTTLLNMHSMI